MITIGATDFTVKMDDLRTTKFVEKTYSRELPPNTALLRIDCFSLTSNNITYGVMGGTMNYWQFFPTPSGYGILPAWGFATVLVSAHPEVQIGERFYGFYPMGSHVLVQCDKVDANGFVDGTAHRQGLPPIYNRYWNTAKDVFFKEGHEGLLAIFRPLFLTSFLLDEHLAEQNFHGDYQIVITGASTKTALALSCLLAQRKEQLTQNLTMVALTSKKNMDFVGELGFYDQVLDYGSVAKLDSKIETVVVDFTGNPDTQLRLQQVLNNNLIYNCLVGLVDWEHLQTNGPLPKKGVFFFAPEHAEKKRKAWGAREFEQRVGSAWEYFMDTAQSTIAINRHFGTETLNRLYAETLDGKMDPSAGTIVSLADQ